MSGISIGELVKQAKGDDRSLREYARDSGVDAAIISKMINGSYLPKKPDIYEALTSPQAAPRGGVTCERMLAAAGASEDFQNGMSAGMAVSMLTTLADIPSSAMIRVLQGRGVAVGAGAAGNPSLAMKPEEIRRIRRIQSERQRFTATANGIILGSLGKRGLTFQLVHTGGAEVDDIRFDTCVRLMGHEITEYLIRYAYIPEEEEGASPALAENTLRGTIEELVFLKPLGTRVVSVVTNHAGAYERLCESKDRLSYNGELAVLLFDLERASILREDYLAHFQAGAPEREIRLI